MAIQSWSGYVAANSSSPINTGLNLRSNASVTIVSEGFGRNYSPEGTEGVGYCGPSGYFRQTHDNAASPVHYIGALLAKTGAIYTAVGGGLLDWSPPTDDNLEFVYNDRIVDDGYGDNNGGFNVTIKYDDEELQE